MANPTSPSNEPYKIKVEKEKTYFWCSCGLSNTEPFFAKFVDPIINKNFLISGWNTTIRAIIPTLINAPIIVDNRSISKNAVMRQTIVIRIIPRKILIATVPLRSLYA